jgi:hypothetical protein
MHMYDDNLSGWAFEAAHIQLALANFLNILVYALQGWPPYASVSIATIESPRQGTTCFARMTLFQYASLHC